MINCCTLRNEKSVFFCFCFCKMQQDKNFSYPRIADVHLSQVKKQRFNSSVYNERRFGKAFSQQPADHHKTKCPALDRFVFVSLP